MIKQTWVLFTVLILSVSSLFGQTPEYQLVKISGSSLASNLAGTTVSFQWIAFNNSSAGGNFYILLNSPSNVQIQSVIQNTSPVSIQNSIGAFIGPFAIPGNSSVTLQVAELLQAATPDSGNRNLVGDKFVLLPEDVLKGSNSQFSSMVVKAGTATPSTDQGLLQSAAAVPNISKDNQPINFWVSL